MDTLLVAVVEMELVAVMDTELVAAVETGLVAVVVQAGCSHSLELGLEPFALFNYVNSLVAQKYTIQIVLYSCADILLTDCLLLLLLHRSVVWRWKRSQSLIVKRRSNLILRAKFGELLVVLIVTIVLLHHYGSIT